MVYPRCAALAVITAVVVASASATYVVKAPEPTPKPKKCYARGERAVGAPGKPAVEYYPCCDGTEPRPVKNDYWFDPSKDWGLFCGGQGNIIVSTKNCYDLGAKAIGAPGKPLVNYKPCCSGVSPREKKGAEIKTADDKWGQFCLSGGDPKPDTGKIRCAGAPGYPYVEYVFCGPEKKCAPSPKDGWGSFCLPKTAKDCVKAGDRNQGETGYPNVPYLPCCSGKPNVSVYGQWGRFCPADGEERRVIVVTNPPTSRPNYKPDVPRGPPPKKPDVPRGPPPMPVESPDDDDYSPSPPRYY